MIVKVCGVRTAEIAAAAVDAGADWIGVVLEPRSPRHAVATDVVAVRAAVRGRAAVVGVLVATPGQDLDAIAVEHRLDALQVHGDITPAAVAAAVVPVIRALNPALPLDLATLDWPASAPVLVDAAPSPDGLPGGTGRRVDLDAAAALAAHRPVLLAGGLGPDTVAAAVRRVLPWGVDASSGLESSPGVKDATLVAAYVTAARGALAATVDGP